MKVLIAYYSWSNNTKALATRIQEQLNSKDTTIFEITPEVRYSLNYQECIEQAKKEINEGYLPKLKTNIVAIEEYDMIFIGSPNWWSTIAPPVATFLNNHDLSGKKIIPFISHGGGGKAQLVEDIGKKCPQSIVLDSLVSAGNEVKDLEIKKWLVSLGITE